MHKSSWQLSFERSAREIGEEIQQGTERGWAFLRAGSREEEEKRLNFDDRSRFESGLLLVSSLNEGWKSLPAALADRGGPSFSPHIRQVVGGSFSSFDSLLLACVYVECTYVEYV